MKYISMKNIHTKQTKFTQMMYLHDGRQTHHREMSNNSLKTPYEEKTYTAEEGE